MTSRRKFIAFAAVASIAEILGVGKVLAAADRLVRTDAEWRKLLTPAQFRVLREAGTEYPFTSPLLNEHREGVFGCAGCELPLFSSKTKFDSGTGWPSFWAPLDDAVQTATDNSLGMERSAVSCQRCDGHLGHVFDDGPKPTGLRYCMNGVAMKFTAAAA
jgi:peptide-methionine (R)-S-oxide reductase